MHSELSARYKEFSDEKLIEMITTDRESYTEEALGIAENILRSRGQEIVYADHLTAEDMNELAPQLSHNSGLDVANDDDENEAGVLDRISGHISALEAETLEQEHQIRLASAMLTDEELLEKYTQVAAALDTENTIVGSRTTGKWMLVFRLLAAELMRRNLVLPLELRRQQKRVAQRVGAHLATGLDADFRLKQTTGIVLLLMGGGLALMAFVGGLFLFSALGFAGLGIRFIHESSRVSVQLSALRRGDIWGDNQG